MVFRWQRKHGIPGTDHNRFWDPSTPDDRFVKDLLETQGRDDNVVNAHVKHVLRNIRFRRAVQPFLDLVKPIITPLDIFYETVREFMRTPAASPYTSANVTVFVPPTANVNVIAPGSGYGVSPTAAVGQAPPLVFEDAGIKVGEVTAYRAWRLHPDGLLHSVYMSDFAWAPGIPFEGDPSPPMSDGVHAFRSREDVEEYALDYSDTCAIVFGTVHLYGSVYEHTKGYRASHAMIASIEDAPFDDDGKPTYDAPALRKKYKLDPLDQPFVEQQSPDE